MIRYIKNIVLLFSFISWVSCEQTLEPKPVDLLTDDIVLNEPKDVPNVEIGLYHAFRNIIPATIISGDFTADMLIHNGTFSQYRELGTKNITSSNVSVSYLWSSIYHTIYVANFILERLPEIQGVKAADRERVLATAHFLRGYSYFIALYSFGGVPEVLTTSIETNRDIPRASEAEIIQLITDDYNAALDHLTTNPSDAGYASDYAVRAALAKLSLYTKDWTRAESFASDVIDSKNYVLDTAFSDVVHKDFPAESIFEVAFTRIDDPGSDANIGLNDLFVGRREIIPSNQIVLALSSTESGERFASIKFNADNLQGSDNGWSVAKYGTKDEDNNVFVFRLAEMYLIRAEARARQGNITGDNSAQSDINTLRTRADIWDASAKRKIFTPRVGSVTQAEMIQLIENERVYELAFEGHRWYDLVRMGRASQVMPLFNSNWKATYEKWPIPQREIQNNPSLEGNQNPGY